MTDASALVALVLQYYPVLGDPALIGAGDWREQTERAPQTQALRSLQKAAAEALPEWSAFLDTIAAQLGDCTVRNQTHVELDASFTAVIGLPNTGEPIARSIVVYASFMAPVYLIYELHDRYEHGAYEVIARLDEPSPAARPAFALIERTLAAQFSLSRLPAAVAEVVVPGVAMDTLLPGQVTLADALFSEQRR